MNSVIQKLRLLDDNLLFFAYGCVAHHYIIVILILWNWVGSSLTAKDLSTYCRKHKRKHQHLVKNWKNDSGREHITPKRTHPNSLHFHVPSCASVLGIAHEKCCSQTFDFTKYHLHFLLATNCSLIFIIVIFLDI